MAVTKAAQSTPPVDQLTTIAITDPEPASIGLLHHVDNTLHALASAWGHPPHTQRLHMLTNGDTRSVLFQVAPSCQWVNIGLLVSGAGSAVITSDASDGSAADTTTLTWILANGDTLEFAEWVWTTGAMDHSTSTDNSPALFVLIDAHKEWSATTYARLQVNPANTGSSDPSGTIWAIAVSPIFEPQAV
ncbi:hypothetical protein [Acinetobacter sp.]|uniref:hypothetical protein n=1 Tax=Acinetobacter sp. TaxID=472 RepID=UPI000C0B5899|nr:hypothetical protein [Acinetobacter sp.]MAK31344.1 hypothetical protein [Acinetobacter sp.]